MIIDDKINSAKKKVEKLEANIIRLQGLIEKKKIKIASGKEEANKYNNGKYWLEFDIESHEDDIKRTQKELIIAHKKLSDWEEKKAFEDRVERIPVIENFLENWKQKAIKWYKLDFARYQTFCEGIKAKEIEFDEWRVKLHGHRWNEEVQAKMVEMGIDRKSIQKDTARNFSALTVRLETYDEWEKQLETIIEEEKVSKRKTLIYRVKAITGEFNDASGLYVGINGEINGTIDGEKGKAKVETISAGGYNIQCYHYRVLVHEVLKK